MLRKGLRPIKIVRNYIPHAEGSCLFSMGNTTVLCVATVQETVPPHAQEQSIGWVSAEYNMLPRAGKQRSSRSKSTSGGRTQEIQRLIGRSLRAVIDLSQLGPRSVLLDCDVILADGGTRTAAINGSFIALIDALHWLKSKGKIIDLPVRDYLAAVSVGIIKGKKVLDLNAEIDNHADVDMNVVMTGSGTLVEVQATAEKVPFTKSELDELIALASRGIRNIVNLEKKLIGKLK